eukprot:CAMPEP_0117042916 /NCGR_PEP_ID=MMETSP0472-20121206/29859_1 /TAXON_ID=693140 ORGANISM="Tiarina fusus, Strain LIS" /NCGR_SAMPLE_ID=MMETSP0472 /ASSEMBLY_ACC=CAM_ASM_000603 /LENGTH=99 /DNA_ID=CAMNT_0004754289 /DNA_START=1 /DNA_END=300 /DNA_ORIENTATION=-
MQSDKTIFLRVKRPNQTVFLSTEPTETIAAAKNRLAAMCEFPAASIKLGFNGEILKDDNTMAYYKISNDNELYQTQIQDGEWESLSDIQQKVEAAQRSN